MIHNPSGYSGQQWIPAMMTMMMPSRTLNLQMNRVMVFAHCITTTCIMKDPRTRGKGPYHSIMQRPC